ncbi:MAG: elongation factor Tu [Methanosarcinaceae archaeon]|nr:elongation factor Tu [Methanosarcinaceae archaeon]
MTKITIIGSEKSGKTTLAGKLGRKSSVSDVTMYDFAKNERVLTTIDATGYPASLKALLTALNLSDIAILCVPPEGLDPMAAECIIGLDLLGYRHGIVLLTKSDLSYPLALEELKEKLRKITKGTSLENWEYHTVSTTTFEGMEELKEMILALDEKVEAEQRKQDGLPARVVIDQSFNVTGIGCVVLGVVMQGTINAKDKMTAYPVKKDLEIRSIQMHDVDVKSAPAGARVGLALKSVQSRDIERGFIISAGEMVATDFTLECALSKLAKEFKEGDMLHLFTGLQSSPVKVMDISREGEGVESAKPGGRYLLKLSGSKEIAYSMDDRFILANLDEKQRFCAFGLSQ